MTPQLQTVEFSVVPHWSLEYRQAIYLRYKLLRQPLGLKYTKAQMEEEVDQIHIIGKINDQIIACLCLVPLEKKVYKMRQVCIREDLQHQGIGKKLVAFCEAAARQNEAKEIVLNARDYVTDFYLKLDYQICSEQFFEIGIPHYKMTKEILIL